MADKVTWTGTQSLTPGREKWSFAEKATVTLKFTGPYAKCLSERPARGTPVTGYESFGMLVDRAEVEELEGEAGELVVTLTSAQLPEESYGSAAIGEAIIEVDWNQVDQAIETHPKCGYLSTANDGTEITWDDWPKLVTHPEAYELAAAASPWTLEQYLSLKRAGVETFPVAQPIVRRTTFHFAKPSDVGVGVFTRQNPPASSFGDQDAYEWVKAHDRGILRDGLYERSTEWWGFKTVSELIYPAYPG